MHPEIFKAKNILLRNGFEVLSEEYGEILCTHRDGANSKPNTKLVGVVIGNISRLVEVKATVVYIDEWSDILVSIN